MLTTPEPIEDDRIVAKCYVELGDVRKEKGEYDESLRYHRKSMEIFERMDDPRSVADSHLSMAEIYKAKGELKQAMSEYEKGLTLYEDIYVDDTNKSTDSGADASLNSSFTSDLQHSKALSKSDETLPQTTFTDITDKDTTVPSSPHLMNGVINTSTSSLDRLNSSTKNISEFEDIPQLTKSIDDSSLVTTEKVGNELVKSFSSSNISDLRYVADNDVLFPLTSPDPLFHTTVKAIPVESQIIETDAPFVPPLESLNEELLSLTTDPLLLDTKFKETNNSNIDHTHRLWYRLPKKPLLIIIFSVFLAGTLFWSFNNIGIRSLLSCSPNDFSLHQNSPTHNYDDLSEQLRKLLTWRKDRMASLNKDTRNVIKEFLTNSDIQNQMTLDEFQRILEILDLKMILIPQ